MNPVIKWAGGKRKLAYRISELLDLDSLDEQRYFEPFLGAGGVLFHICPTRAMCFDVNVELMNFYSIVAEKPYKLVEKYNQEYAPNHCEQFYYKIRNMDRDHNFQKVSKLERAVRFFYLNKNCFNGLWRENQKGQNNCPWNHKDEAAKIELQDIIELSKYISKPDVIIKKGSYLNVEKHAVSGDIVYFDPPYDKEIGQNGFSAYNKSDFNPNNQKDLKMLCDRLVLKGVKVGISNSNTRLIRELYSSGPVKYEFIDMKARRSIGSSAETRKIVTELFILGVPYE